jgi:aspartyl-tRNA(Asn)/glutamyl-tRNA(Gln) amidotransferase subunit A
MPSKAAFEIGRMDALTLTRLVRGKQISPTEVVDAVLERMEILDPHLRAFCVSTADLARTEARRIEKRLLAGDPVGPLVGVPYGVKDLICTAGIRTTFGSVAYADHVPDEDDIVVERMRAAGAIILGKTNVSELGYSGLSDNPVFETTRNPWNPDRTPGGSSAGAGAAVAAGMGPFALGSDGGGSIRIPSSLCGVFGMKPSMGRVPLYPGTRDERYPGASSFESLEHIGPMSRTVADATLMLSVVASGPDMRDRHSLPAPGFEWTRCLEGDLKGKRVAFSVDFGYARVSPEVRQVIASAVSVFERELGCIVDFAHPDLPPLREEFWALIALESDLRGMRALVERHGAKMTPNLVSFVTRDWTAEHLTAGVVARKRATNAMWRFMQRYDLLLTPTVAVAAFPLSVRFPPQIDGKDVGPADWTPFLYPFNMTGQPAASVPAGFTEDGLPVGLQIVGRHLDDPLVLRAAAAFEAARPWRDKWPPIVVQAGL